MNQTSLRRLVVALTGGIASGKSQVSSRFEQLGVAVVDADVVARALVEPGQPALLAIVARFGKGILNDDGRLDRQILRDLVFDDERARHDLNSILHPPIRTALRVACELDSSSPYSMAVIPLLTEGGGRLAYPWVDRIVLVDVERDVQLQRLVRRDRSTPEQAERILAAQATRDERLAMADDVIENGTSLAALDAQVAVLHQDYLQLAAGRTAHR